MVGTVLVTLVITFVGLAVFMAIAYPLAQWQKKHMQRMQYKDEYIKFKAKYDAENRGRPLTDEEIMQYIKDNGLDDLWPKK